MPMQDFAHQSAMLFVGLVIVWLVIAVALQPQENQTERGCPGDGQQQ